MQIRQVIYYGLLIVSSERSYLFQQAARWYRHIIL